MTKSALSHLCLLPLAFFSIELYAVNPPCATAPPGLVAWWRGENSGADAIGTNTATLLNGASFTNAMVGQGFWLDGIDDRVIVGDSPALNFGPAQSFSIEAWIQAFPSSTDFGIMSIVDKRLAPNISQAQGYEFNLDNGQIHFRMSDSPGDVGSSYGPAGPDLQDGQFHHVAVTVPRGATNGGRLFVDGQLVLIFDPTSEPGDLSTTEPFRIGNHATSSLNTFFKGTIDEVSVYNRALGTNEIVAIYAAGPSGKCVPIPPSPCVAPPPGLVSWWAGQGNALDSADSNNGSLSGNAAFGEGRVGQAFTLDGNADAIVVGNPTNLQLQNFTIETWMRRANASISSFGSHGNALLFGYGSGGYGLGFRDDGSVFLTRVDIDNVTITNGITDTLWHHVAVTKIDTNVVFYIDGTAYTAPPYNTTFTFATVAAIGARADTMDDSLLGAVDEVSVYNRVLSAAEIQAIYNAGASGKCRTPTKPFILTQPAGIAAYIGDSVTLSVVAGGDVPLSYQWLLNGSSLPGRTGAALTLANIQTTNAGLYSVSISNAADSVLSSNALVTVGPRPPCVPAAPGIVSWWPAQSNALDAIDNNNGTLLGNVTLVPGRVGQAFRFDGSADAVRVGNPTNLQLQDFTIETWIKRSSPTIATFGTHTTALFFGYGSGGYGFGMFDDGRLFLSKIDIDNVALTTGLTDTNNFHHIAVTKSNTTVVFYIDGVAFPEPAYSSAFSFSTQAAIGARGDTLDDSFFGSIDELAVYSRALGADEILAIYNADGSGKCRVPRPPAIVTQPRSQTNYIGDTVTFAVGATGDPPLSYQWRFEGNNLAGRTASSLVLGNVQTNSAGNYSVIVTNAVGSVTSSNALLAVVPRPPCTPIPNGLVSWWRGENNLVDGAGLNDGVATTASPLFSPGKVGNAFNFVNSRFLQVPDAPSLRLTNSLSLEAWVFPTLTGSALRTIISKPPAVVPIFPPAPPAPPQGGYLFALTNNGAVVFSLITRTGVQATNRTLVTSQLLPP
ncbi:MAG TPA: LamG-like jellyroll fold domain-containing protein, partial [Methylomirabilota bacterium]|nr:LamG-like jellyroll fold domain-containing protein [Methylomirabilota bacterium]